MTHMQNELMCLGLATLILLTFQSEIVSYCGEWDILVMMTCMLLSWNFSSQGHASSKINPTSLLPTRGLYRKHILKFCDALELRLSTKQVGNYENWLCLELRGCWDCHRPEMLIMLSCSECKQLHQNMAWPRPWMLLLFESNCWCECMLSGCQKLCQQFYLSGLLWDSRS